MIERMIGVERGPAPDASTPPDVEARLKAIDWEAEAATDSTIAEHAEPLEWNAVARAANVYRRELEAALRREAALRDALRWLVNIGCGVGKAGGSPEPGEFEAAIASGKAALTGGPRTEAEHE